MSRSYLPRKYHILTFLLIGSFWFFGFYLLMILGLIIYLFFCVLLRMSRSSFREDTAFKKNVLFSPVNGKILKIDRNLENTPFGSNMLRIQIAVPWWREMGVYLPVTSEVKNMEVNEGASLFRYNRVPDNSDPSDKLFKSLCLLLEGVNSERVGLQFIKCPSGAWPEIGVVPGDRGRAQVNIGYFPFGGTVLVYLPSTYELLVEPESDVLAGETLLAGTPELV